MPLPTINIPDFAGVSTAVPVANPGRHADADSSAVALSAENVALLTNLATLLTTIDGRVDGLEAVLGTATDAATANGAAGSVDAHLRAIKDAATDVTTPSPVKIDQTTPGSTNAVSVQTPADVISFVPTLDTAAYAANDVLFATAAIAGVTRVNDGRAMLVSLTAIDKSKQKPAMTIFFYQTNVTSAAANAANNLSDADAITCLGYVRLAAADWIDLANNSFLCYSGSKAPNLLLEAAAGSTTVYAVGILDAGTPTFAVADLMLKLGFVQS